MCRIWFGSEFNIQASEERAGKGDADETKQASPCYFIKETAGT
jgi:hypothetical protein